MLKFLIQKKVILTLLLFFSFLVLLFSFKVEWLKNPSFLDTLKENLTQKTEKGSQVLAQEYAPYFFPYLPQRLIYLLSEIDNLNKELVEFNEKLYDKLNKSNCQFTLSQCLPKITFGGLKGCNPVGVLGFPYEPGTLDEIEGYKDEIAERIDNLTFLRELLEAEIESSLPQELATLRREVAEELKNKLNEVLNESQKIIETAKDNQDLYSKDYTEKCLAQCEQKEIPSIEACLQITTGPQKHIEIKAEAEVSLDDLELGEVKIDKFGLALPDKLRFPKLGDITLTIPPQTLQVCSPLEPITISFDPPAFASLPNLSFTCPKLSLKEKDLSYQCGQSFSNEKVETGPGSNWYFETLSWLMEECADLPTMKDEGGILKKEAANCYAPDKVVETIINECNSLWREYCQSNSSGAEPPQICKEIRDSCNDKNREIAATTQCQNLFKQEKLPLPSECSYITLKNKCQELKDKGRKEIPLPCRILPLFTGKIEAPDSETYSSPGISCPSQKLLNTPLGFGGGIGFNCPIGLPWSPPKIDLPDIIIPDLTLPQLKVPPFFEVKLPKIIFEDLILPDIELCDLNDCSDIFPYLYFKLPQLNLPSFDISVPIPQLPGLDLRTRIDLPSISFSLPQINLFNLLLPELELPKISLPSPKFNFKITGIDLSAIFELIYTFILNALDVPDIDICYTFQTPKTFLSIVLSDYYFSFIKFPKIPEIPFCQNVNQFCKRVKDSLGQGGWLKKASEIEAQFAKTIGDIQKELDQLSQAVKNLQEAINKTFQEVYGRAIYEAIVKQLRDKGLSLKDYINPETKEIDLRKVPFPGVFPVKVAEDKECLPVSIPEAKFTLKIVDKNNYSKIETKEISPSQYEIYVPIDLPEEITIPWPEKLKEINLINPLSYDLPDIPLSDLSYKKEFPIKTVGFQPRTFSFDFGGITEGDCLAQNPTGGNPFPITDITNNLDNIKKIHSKLKDASQIIIEILE